MNCHEAGALLDAYVDREVEPERAGLLEAHLDACPACRRRVEDLERLGSLVRSAPYHTAPAALRTRVAGMRWRWRLPQRLAVAAALLAAVSLGGLLAVRALRAGRVASASASVAEAVADGHVRALMGDHLLDVRSTDQHTVKPWFLGKIDFSPQVDDLAAIGFPLIGGRLDYIDGRPAAALVYQRRQHVINLFVWPAGPDGEPAGARSIRGYQIRHWTRNGLAFWAVSDLNDFDLGQFARALQH